MAVTYTFSTQSGSIPLAQLDANFATPITIGNTSVQLGNTITTLNNITLANTTISSGNVTLTNVSIITANVTTANITNAVIGTANVTTANITSGVIATANITTGNVGTLTLTNALGTASGGTGLTSFTSGGVVYASSTSALTTGSSLVFNGSNLGIGTSSPSDKLVAAGGVHSTGNPSSLASGQSIFMAAYTTYGRIEARDWTGAAWLPIAIAPNGGNVGIGTSSPSYKLDVVTAGPSGARVTTAEYGQFVLTDGTRSMYLQNYAGLGSIGTSSNNDLGFAINSVEKMRLDSSGNLGLGVTPSAWGNSGNIDLPTGSGISFGSAGGVIASNAYFNSGWKYKTSQYAVKYDQQQNAGAHYWYIAPSGTAGTAITFTQAMTLDNSGNLLLGSTTNYNSAGFAKTFSLYDASSINISLTNASKQYQIGITGTSLGIYDGTASAYRMYLDTSGNLGIGTTSPARKLDVAATMRIADGSSVEWGGTSLYIAGTSNTLLFATSSSEKMRLDSSGNLGIGTTSPSASAILDAQSTTKGVRMPNMTTTQKNAISSPAAGLMVFDTTLAKLCVYSGSAWQTITSV